MKYKKTDMRRRYAPDFQRDLNALFATGRANGYIFVIHPKRRIITVSHRRKHITTFELSGWGMDNARCWLKAVCEVKA